MANSTVHTHLMFTFPSVRTSMCMATTLRLSVKFGIGICYEKGCRGYQSGVVMGKIQGDLHETLVCFIIAGDIKSP